MKVIYVMADSMRRDHVSPYGSPPWGAVRTPNLARFATQALLFENAYIGSFPTVPNRRDTHLGHGDKGLPFNRWKPLDSDEVTFPALLRERGVPSMLITDTQNNVTRGINIQRDYSAWVCNRGQEADPVWMDAQVPLRFPVPRHLIRYGETMWHRILTNRAQRREESDWFAPGTYTMAMRWLEQNYRREHFFLWVDTFDPHEPWDPPQHYVDLYDPGYRGRVFEAPTYGQRKEMGITDRELEHIRARYGAEVTMVDTWFGRLLAKLESLGILDETVIVFTADHGTCFDGPGDHGMLQKLPTVGADGMVMAGGRPAVEPLRHYPLSLNVARVPLMIRMPGGRRGRVHAIVQPWDMTATILNLFGVTAPARVAGTSLVPLLERRSTRARHAAVFGNNTVVQIVRGSWCYATWHKVRRPVLFDLKADPWCRRDVIRRHPEAAAALHRALVSFARAHGGSEEFAAQLVRPLGQAR